MDKATLTFAALNARVDALPDHESLSITPTARQRWGYIVGFGAGFIALLAANLLPSSKLTSIIVTTMMVVEIAGLVFALLPRRPWKLPGFASERRDFADQLDFDLHHHEDLTAWLSTFPRERLEAMAQYASQRHERLKDKHPLVSGGIEKLGALPIAVALFLQFKDFHWPPHPTWPEFILGFAIIGLYWSALLVVSIRFRAQHFATLLAQAAATAQGAKHEKEPAGSTLLTSAS
ncbi:hypothetical protein [Dyella sp. C9]|uniref:hypothetical protein n=1 Tax=Dyella sp. C9 TaxID=2202154 RepID=UPI000DEEB5A3|nr:hypothetical protein [Dyella sp. C9]